MRPIPLLFLSAVLAGCTSGGSAPSTASPPASQRAGQAPPEFADDVRWLNAPPTTLAGLRGRAVFVQFAFPT